MRLLFVSFWKKGNIEGTASSKMCSMFAYMYVLFYVRNDSVDLTRGRVYEKSS